MDVAGTLKGQARVRGRAGAAEDDAAIEPPPAIGGNERRMHVRAYNYWVSLLAGRQFPAIAELQPDRLDDFGRNSVLLDFGADSANPHIAWLGTALREEGGMADDVRTIGDVPERSLLSRLTEHYLQIMANRAPIGFEAEFVNARGNLALYRGILLPFSSGRGRIDFIYGVINWKELADPATAAEIMTAARAAFASGPRGPVPAAALPLWADGPGGAGFVPDERIAPAREAAGGDATPAIDPGALADRLVVAREAGSALRAAEMRNRGALYRALGVAYDLAIAADGDAAGYAALLAHAGLRSQRRAPWMPIVRLVFGADHNPAALRAHAAVLAHAWRHDVAAGGLRGFLENSPDGLRGIVADERACRRAG